MTTSAAPSAVPASAAQTGATPSAPWLASSTAQPYALPQQLQLGQRRAEDALGFPLAGGLFLLALVAVAIVLRLRVGKFRSSSASPGVSWQSGWQRLLDPRGVRRGSSSSDDGIAVECQVRIDTATQLQVVRWAGGRLLLATNAQGVMLIDRTDSPAESGRMAS